MRKLVRESLHARMPMPKEQFLEWLDDVMEENDSEDWEFIVSQLVNDEETTDEHLHYNFMENGIDPELAKGLLQHRTEFLNYGLDIQI